MICNAVEYKAYKLYLGEMNTNYFIICYIISEILEEFFLLYRLT